MGVFISRGLGGMTAYFPGRKTITSSMMNPYPFVERLVAQGEEVEGAWVVDLISIADRQDFVSLVWSEPIIDADIPDEEGWRPAILNVSESNEALANAFFGERGVEALRRSDGTQATPGPFDSVSPAYCARYWAEKGAIIGRVIGGQIVWEPKIDQKGAA